MDEHAPVTEELSSWWLHTVILTMVFGFTVLLYLAARAYKDAPPIPAVVVAPGGETVFTGADVIAGQQVFLKYGLMENGTVWGHGAYLGPDFSAEYLHQLSLAASEAIATARFSCKTPALTVVQRTAVQSEVAQLLQENRFDASRGSLLFTAPEVSSYRTQIAYWTEYFSGSKRSAGLPAKFISDASELRQLVSFFGWTAWASVARRPGRAYSYTNNFPYDPSVGNVPSSEAVLWSALSLIMLLGALAVVLFSFGKFDYLGWGRRNDHVHPQMVPGVATESQRAVVPYFVVVAALFLLQVLIGGGVAHYRADPASFYGFDISRIFPSNLLRTWHLQLAIFWIATAYIAGGLFLAPAVGGAEPKGQARRVRLLLGALVAVVLGSMLGEWLGINQWLGWFWFWFGHQGWEYLDLGRFWQLLLAAALVFWFVLLYRGIAPAMRDPKRSQMASLLLYAAVAIPLFYLPALFFDRASHFTVVDFWRFWIIHLWVEGFFELFATVMVATIFFQIGLVSRVVAARVVYLDALLYLGSGIVGTGHHWYWTGHPSVTMALAAMFSAMEAVPLTLLTLDAWDFVALTRARCDTCQQDVSVPHRWTFYFLMAVGFWNFVGAGIFGFMINLPIVSYFETGTLLTPNHGHAAMMGVFGMLAMALLVFALRQVLSDEQWRGPEKLIRISFWGLNGGLALMVVLNLFPAGVLQLWDVLNNGYWHARGQEFLGSRLVSTIEWMRLPADLIFIFLGVAPMFLAVVLGYMSMRATPSPEASQSLS